VLESAAGDHATEGGAFVANGARSVLNSFMLDGVDNNARIVDQQNSSNVVSQPSVDALSEFSIQTNNFSAEYGQAAGAVINATIEFLRNDAFDARNPFAAPAEDKRLKRHQYGGTLGGPMRRVVQYRRRPVQAVYVGRHRTPERAVGAPGRRRSRVRRPRRAFCVRWGGGDPVAPLRSGEARLWRA
jgi:hypothetical protein